MTWPHAAQVTPWLSPIPTRTPPSSFLVHCYAVAGVTPSNANLSTLAFPVLKAPREIIWFEVDLFMSGYTYVSTFSRFHS